MAEGFSREQWADWLSYNKIPKGAYSYIIYKEGDIYYAKNGLTGMVDYSGTDAATVIQSANDALTDGGTIYVKTGDYLLSDSLLLSDGISLLGEGKFKTKFYCTSQINSGNPMIRGGSYSRIANLQVKGFGKLDTDDDQLGIYVGDYGIIENCYITYTSNDPIYCEGHKGIRILNNYIYNVNEGIEIHNCSDVVIAFNKVYLSENEASELRCEATGEVKDIIYFANHFEDTDDGITFHSSDGNGTFSNIHIIDNSFIDCINGIRDGGIAGSSITDLFIKNNHFERRTTKGAQAMNFQYATIDRAQITGNNIFYMYNFGFYIISGIQNALIEGNTFIQIALDDAIRLAGTTDILKIRNNIFNTIGDGAGDYAIQVAVGTDYMIEFNKFINISDSGIISVPATSIIRFNDGYTTKNRGTAIFSGDGSTTSFSIPHGLAATPSKVRVSPASPDAEGVYSSRYDADATNIVAKFKTAPPAPTVEDSNLGNISGTSNTITDDGKSWTADEWIGHYVRITGGTGSGQCRRIIDNDATTLTVSPDWDTIPDATSTYDIIDSAIEIEWYAEV